MIRLENNEYNVTTLNNFIGCYIEEFLNTHRKNSEHTYKSYKSALNSLFKDLINKSEYRYITASDIEYNMGIDILLEYFDLLYEKTKDDGTKKYTNQTLNHRQTVVKSFLTYLTLRKIINYNLDELKLLTSLKETSQEIEMIPFELSLIYMDYFRNEENGLEKYLIIKLAIETALRASELLDLSWNNFVTDKDSDGVIMKSHGNNKGKGNKEWIDKISHELYNELLQLKTIGNNTKLFTLTYKQLADMMDRGNKLWNHTGINYSFHSFKKLAVTMCYLNNGNCIDSAMKKARHSNVNTTMRYLRLTDLNVTGIISAKMTTSEELYKTVSHKLLLECLEEMRPEMLLLLNNKIKNKSSASD